MEAILAGKINAGDIVVIRYEGPKGGPGMREMLAVTGAMKGAGRGADAALDHRRPLLRRHPRVLRRPRRARGRRRRPDRVRARRRPDRDRRRTAHTIDLMVDGAELEARKADWKLPEPRYTERVPRQVRPPRAGCRDRRDHERLTATRERRCRGEALGSVLALLGGEDRAVRARGRQEAGPRIVARPAGRRASDQLLAVGGPPDEVRVGEGVGRGVRLQQQGSGPIRPVHRRTVDGPAVVHRDRAGGSGRVRGPVDSGARDVVGLPSAPTQRSRS